MTGLRSLYERTSLTALSTAALVVALLVALLQFSPSSRIHNHCRALQRDGWWANRQRLEWQPAGCTMHTYTDKDVLKCLAPRAEHGDTQISEHMLFIGDSSMRNKFYALARLVDPAFMDRLDEPKVHGNLSVGWPGIGGTVARFVWDPYLSMAQTKAVLAGAQTGGMPTPRVLVVGSGAWFLRNSDDSGGLHAWRGMVDMLATQVRALLKDGGAEHVYISPVTPVVPELLTPERQRTLDPDTIANMNDYMDAIDLPVFAAWSAMLRDMALETLDGLHYSMAINDRAIQVLLNRVCNAAVVSADAQPPFHTTCCFEYPAPNWLVRVLALGVAVLALAALGAVRFGWAPRVLPEPATLRHLVLFGALLLLMFVCDRTPLFAKLHKSFSARTFALLGGLALALGAASWREDKAGAGFLGRQQTEEWKGWMQLAILGYHLLNASGVSGIYNPVRVLVAMYLFMTGYGHCCFFVRKRDFGLRRLSAVLLRTNVLAVALAYTMGTSYMDYYFAPLSSAWFLAVWLTMRVAPAHNHTRAVWLKLAASAIATQTVNRLHLWPFGLLERLGVSWSRREWEFRFGLDILVVYAGMATALIHMRYGARLQEHALWPRLRLAAVAASLATVAAYFWFELTRADKFAYNAWHPYVSPAVVVAFVVLRNASERLRTHSSAAFRFAGGISLELFIAQFHLFLAADTKAVLVLVHPRLWFVNLAVVSLVFAGMCQLLSETSAAIVQWLMAVPAAAPSKPDSIALAEMGSLGTDVANQDQDEQQNQNQNQNQRLALDRLSAIRAPPRLSLPVRIARNLPHTLTHSLALRWIVGLALLTLLNQIY
ncbi:hypothetical protein GGI07_004275 [Coemansia sp. Benny D115]|nr:hypothetical protein GGI07_004275 [Coemansia sp. Benny D115]